MLFPTSMTRLLALAALILILLAGASPAQKAASPEAVALKEIVVSFKLDTRITQGMYMGERWVSPPTFGGVQEGKKFILEARVHGFDAQGRPMDINPTWTPADPAMVEVSPGQGKQVKITVLQAGQSSLKIEAQGVSKTLSIKSKYLGNVIYVDVSSGEA